MIAAETLRRTRKLLAKDTMMQGPDQSLIPADRVQVKYMLTLEFPFLLQAVQAQSYIRIKMRYRCASGSASISWRDNLKHFMSSTLDGASLS